MAKPQIGGRVPQDLKDDFDDFAEEHGLTQSDAQRRLLRAGLDHEKGVAADGGEVLDRVDELKQQQRKAEREERIQNALLGGVIAAGAFTVSGVASNVPSLLVTLLLALALVGHSLLPVVRRVGSDE